MDFKHIIIVFLGLSLLSFGLPKTVHKKVHKEISEVFEVENFNLTAVSIPVEIEQTLPSRFDEDNFFKIESNDKFMAYAYVSQAASKTALFDYLVLLDKDLVVLKTIKNTKIL